MFWLKKEDDYKVIELMHDCNCLRQEGQKLVFENGDLKIKLGEALEEIKRLRRCIKRMNGELRGLTVENDRIRRAGNNADGKMVFKLGRLKRRLSAMSVEAGDMESKMAAKINNDSEDKNYPYGSGEFFKFFPDWNGVRGEGGNKDFFASNNLNAELAKKYLDEKSGIEQGVNQGFGLRAVVVPLLVLIAEIDERLMTLEKQHKTKT